MARAHWQAISPTPPAAAWNSTKSPVLSPPCGCVLRSRYCTVRPLSIIAAPSSNEIASGRRTTLRDGMTRRSQYAPGGVLAYAARSPGLRCSTPGPTASTTPAASMPSASGSAFGYRPVRW